MQPVIDPQRKPSNGASSRKPDSDTNTTPEYRMPAEWEPHESTWLAWPHFRNDWPGKFEPIPWVYAEIIRHLTRHERVDLIVQNAAAEKQATKILTRSNALSEMIRFHRWPTDRVWTRDSGCTFVFGTAPSEMPSRRWRSGDLASSGLVAVAWRFNAWAKYPNWKKDAKIASRMAKAAAAREIVAKQGDRYIVLEGGSIDVNGQGTMLTTEECLLSKTQQRNPGLTREDYEGVFAALLGIEKVIWLDKGIEGDDTHGHVDDLARFVAPDTVVTVVEENAKDTNYGPLQENLHRLKSATDQDGNPLRIIELPMPRPITFDNRRLPASYANFYIANGIVLVPVFNDPNDRLALNILADLFPDHEVIGIYSGDLIWGFGAMHCMTQQQPGM
jgi:agmatine deiminase